MRRWQVAFGIDTAKAAKAWRGLGPYRADLRELRRQSAEEETFPLASPYPCLDDRFATGGSASGHYFHQDLLVARRIFAAHPDKHVDVGSRVDGFVAHVAAFRPIEVIDIRPIAGAVHNISFLRADLMKPVDDELREYCDSLSCLHALEHFGLGRYGDPVDCAGHVRGLENLRGMLRTGGRLYLSVPIGPQRIEFNAHRVFSVRYLLELFEPGYRVDRFSYVDDGGRLHEDAELSDANVESDFGCNYGCGIFELTKV